MDSKDHSASRKAAVWLLGQSSRNWIWGIRSVHSPEGTQHFLAGPLPSQSIVSGQMGAWQEVSSSCKHRGLSQREKYEMMTSARVPWSLPRRALLSYAQARTEFGFDQTLSREPKQTIAGPCPAQVLTTVPGPPLGAVIAGNGLRAQRKSQCVTSVRKALVSRKEKQSQD